MKLTLLSTALLITTTLALPLTDSSSSSSTPQLSKRRSPGPPAKPDGIPPGTHSGSNIPWREFGSLKPARPKFGAGKPGGLGSGPQARDVIEKRQTPDGPTFEPVNNPGVTNGGSNMGGRGGGNDGRPGWIGNGSSGWREGSAADLRDRVGRRPGGEGGET